MRSLNPKWNFAKVVYRCPLIECDECVAAGVEARVSMQSFKRAFPSTYDGGGHWSIGALASIWWAMSRSFVKLSVVSLRCVVNRPLEKSDYRYNLEGGEDHKELQALVRAYINTRGLPRTLRRDWRNADDATDDLLFECGSLNPGFDKLADNLWKGHSTACVPYGLGCEITEALKPLLYKAPSHTATAAKVRHGDQRLDFAYVFTVTAPIKPSLYDFQRWFGIEPRERMRQVANAAVAEADRQFECRQDAHVRAMKYDSFYRGERGNGND